MQTPPTHTLPGRALFALAVGLQLMTSRVNATDLSDIVAPSAKVKLLASDYSFTEGPAYSSEGFLLFSDIPNSRIVKLTTTGEASDYIQPSGKANGLIYDRAGRLFACQGGARRVVRFAPGSTDNPTVLAESYDGKKLNSPNDLSLDDHGGFYFTDPRFGPQDDLEQPVHGVYHVDAGGKVTRVIEDLERPNGILVSPGGEYLYVAEMRERQLHRYDILQPGKLSSERISYTSDPEHDRGGPDGLALDEHGNVYATYRPITVLTPDLKLIGRIPVPKNPANCAFGGKEGKTLFITARDSVYSIPLRVAGFQRDTSPPGKTSKAEAKRLERVGTLTLRVPESWVRKPPRSRMRLGEFEIPPQSGDAEGATLAIFHFGSSGAGSARANQQRWIGQFAPEGRKVLLSEGEAGAQKFTVVDLAGTFNKPDGPPIQRRSKPVPGSRVINVMLDADDGAYFFKLAGLEETVGASKAALLESFGGRVSDSAKGEEIDK